MLYNIEKAFLNFFANKFFIYFLKDSFISCFFRIFTKYKTNVTKIGTMKISKNHTIDIPSYLFKETGVDVRQCYQCGKCTAGCVLAEDMDYPSSYILRLLQTKNEDDYCKVLSSEAIWICLNCENCIGRCPKEVDIPRLMDYLRSQSLDRGLVNEKSKRVVAFHRSFLDSVKYTGRLYEVGLEADYKLRTMDFFQDMNLVPAMLQKGKLKIKPEIVKGRKELLKIFKDTSGKQ